MENDVPQLERISSGINELDSLIEGGYPKSMAIVAVAPNIAYEAVNG